MSPPPRPARRPRLAIVEEAERLTPSLLRVVLGGAGLAGFEAGAFTDHYVKLKLPPPGADYCAPFDLDQLRRTLPRELQPRTRTYSVRAWELERRRLTIDFLVHGQRGIGGPWAEGAEVGDTLQLLGPGGAYAPDPQADWHLMVGDHCVLPAIAAALERVPEGCPVHALIQVEGAEEELELSTAADLRLTWLHGDGEDLLPKAVAELELPAGRPHAFVHGEAGAVRVMRRHLVAERGVPTEALSVSGYWKRSRDEEGWREDKAEWNRLVEADAAAARVSVAVNGNGRL